MNKYYHQTDLQIRFNDIDIAGHVNNAVHLYYYDYGRMGYFNEVFKNSINWREKGLVIVNISVDYMLPVYLEDKIQVETKIVKIGNKSIEMIQQIRQSDDVGHVYSKNKSVLVGYHYKENYSFDIPEEWRMRIQDFEKDMD